MNVIEESLSDPLEFICPLYMSAFPMFTNLDNCQNQFERLYCSNISSFPTRVVNQAYYGVVSKLRCWDRDGSHV